MKCPMLPKSISFENLSRTEVFKMIDSYRFGAIVIDGKGYNSDVIIFRDHIDDKWWRKECHTLHIEDIEEIAKEKPDILIVGTGDSGLVKILPETENYLRSKDIKLIAKPTKDACKTYNKLYNSKNVIAALHLTC